MKIFVGNLANETSESGLRQSFEKFGEVSRVTIVMDKLDGKPKGFGFVEMPTTDQANAAIHGLNGKGLDGRALTINESRANANRSNDKTDSPKLVPTGTPEGTLPDGNK